MSKITEGTTAKANLVVKAEAQNLSFYYGAFNALKSINMPIYEKRVTALIGPSGCGKSTYLRCFNRMHDLYAGNRYEGEIRLQPDNTNLLNQQVDPIEVRMRISMVFQKPNPFPKSIYENVAYGLRVRGVRALRPSTRRWSKRCAVPPFGTKSKTGSTIWRSTCPGGSSSAFVSRGRSPPSRRSFCSMNPPRRSTRSRRRASRS